MRPRLTSLGSPVDEADVQSIEQRIGGRLPPDYRKFLLRTNGAVPDPRGIGAPRSSMEWTVNVLFGLTRNIASSNLGSMLDILRETLPLGYLPVAATDTGEFVLLGLSPSAGGPVVLWQWQLEEPPGVQPHLYPLAEDFTSFLAAFHEVPS